MAQEDYAHPELLVDAQWVDAHKDDANVVVVDTDVEAGFNRGHIPGAVMVPDNFEKNPDTGRVHIMSPEQFSAVYAETRAVTNRALNMNFSAHAVPGDDEQKAARARALMAPFFMEFNLGEVPVVAETYFPFGEAVLKAVLEAQPRIVSFFFGLPDARFVTALKAAGAVILCTATTPAEARDLETRGVDAIIAQGWEAGGHHAYYLSDKGAQTGTMALVPQIVDAVGLPVIAAGGIADGRGIAAALALGAAGVQIGTAFLTTAEAGISAPHRAALMASDGSDTRPTRAFSGRPARTIVNRCGGQRLRIGSAVCDDSVPTSTSWSMRTCRSSSMTRRPTSRCCPAALLPSSSISPSTRTRRRASAAKWMNDSSEAAVESGLAL